MKKNAAADQSARHFWGNAMLASAYHNTGSIGTRDDARIATRSVLVGVDITKGHGGRFDIRLVDHDDNATAESAARETGTEYPWNGLRSINEGVEFGT